MSELQEAMQWLLNKKTGLSSECMMATLLCGYKVGGGYDASHPWDPSDFKRCVGLLDAVPAFREKLHIMRQVSKYWSVLVDNWSELEQLLQEEYPTGSAPKMYKRMKELFKSVEKESEVGDGKI